MVNACFQREDYFVRIVHEQDEMVIREFFLILPRILGFHHSPPLPCMIIISTDGPQTFLNNERLAEYPRDQTACADRCQGIVSHHLASILHSAGFPC